MILQYASRSLMSSYQWRRMHQILSFVRSIWPALYICEINLDFERLPSQNWCSLIECGLMTEFKVWRSHGLQVEITLLPEQNGLTTVWQLDMTNNNLTCSPVQLGKSRLETWQHVKNHNLCSGFLSRALTN